MINPSTWTTGALPLLTLGSLWLVAMVSADVCEHFGAQCPSTSACCKQGYCSADPNFCTTGCIPNASYSPQSCFPQPKCVDLSIPEGGWKGESIIPLQNFTGDPGTGNWTSDFQPNHASVNGAGDLILTLSMDGGSAKNEFGKPQGFGATISSIRSLDYGAVTAKIKSASTSPGVVSSLIVRNSYGDEIDFEWVGKEKKEVQSNFYWNNELDYTKSVHHPMPEDPTVNFYTYGIRWTPDEIQWLIEGSVVRTVYRNTTTFIAANSTYKYPSRPALVQLGIWDGGQGLQGTADWAGTPTDWADPNKKYDMTVKNLDVSCFYKGNTTTETWPPAGYGPPGYDKSKGGSVNGTDKAGGGGGGSTGSTISSVQVASTVMLGFVVLLMTFA
ncbi:glycosyl hydrolases family 16-domain-containing protein [Piptocephalis cylindrospora]|uniref:Glycosyl hydrolases family 16-domain-containing protein n=1 Tax=Piptocephalis cylindrospora TaxID=1907219 RepID=A0A4P9Y7T0_9FUNG|nr:glycosyl hydrolases family 16-domain-containing protein [Piptocephalis cylindrospora]|eukprot:RKP15065.1 glycosyl hydrolases family 16-domain-containing protein [Piptocephalis cylindrospora]